MNIVFEKDFGQNCVREGFWTILCSRRVSDNIVFEKDFGQTVQMKH